MRRKWSQIENVTWDRAQELRRSLTTSEKLLWRKLRNEQLGVRIRRQHPVGPYIADFFVPSCSLIIELDGDSHLSPVQEEFDRRRTEYLQQLGHKVIRFQNHLVKHSIELVLEQIRIEIEKSNPDPEAPLNPPKTTS